MEDPGELLDSDPGTRMEGSVVLVVTDVLVSPSSVVTEFCDDSSGSLMGNLLNRSPILSPKSGFGQLRKKR